MDPPHGSSEVWPFYLLWKKSSYFQDRETRETSGESTRERGKMAFKISTCLVFGVLRRRRSAALGGGGRLKSPVAQLPPLLFSPTYSSPLFLGFSLSHQQYHGAELHMSALVCFVSVLWRFKWSLPTVAGFSVYLSGIFVSGINETAMIFGISAKDTSRCTRCCYRTKVQEGIYFLKVCLATAELTSVGFPQFAKAPQVEEKVIFFILLLQQYVTIFKKKYGVYRAVNLTHFIHGIPVAKC